MHKLIGKQPFVVNSLTYVLAAIGEGSQHVRAAIGEALSSNDPVAIEKRRALLSMRLSEAREQAKNEPSRHDAHYVSRFDAVGLFQVVLAKVFRQVPELQGYGDLNPSWISTIFEEVTYEAKTFFENVYEDVHGGKKPLLQSIIAELQQLRFDRAPYPTGTPVTIAIPD